MNYSNLTINIVGQMGLDINWSTYYIGPHTYLLHVHNYIHTCACAHSILTSFTFSVRYGSMRCLPPLP